MKNRNSLLLLAASLAVSCSKPQPVASNAPPKGVPTGSVPSDPAPTSPTKTPTPPADTSSTAPKTSSDQASPPPVVPDALKNDAYSYYGLGDETPQKQTITLSGTSGKTYDGTHTVKLQGATSDKAVFKETQTGGPQGDIEQTVSLTKDGVFIESVDPYTLKTPHVLQLPSDLKPGSTWNYKMDLDMNGKGLNVGSTGKVVGEQQIKTKSGTVTALYITSQGSGTYDSKKVQLQDDWWYAKGKGLVKSKETLTIGDQKQTVEIETTG